MALEVPPLEKGARGIFKSFFPLPVQPGVFVSASVVGHFIMPKNGDKKRCLQKEVSEILSWLLPSSHSRVGASVQPSPTRLPPRNGTLGYKPTGHRAKGTLSTMRVTTIKCGKTFEVGSL